MTDGQPDESLDGSDTASRASNDDGTTLMKSIMNAFKPINSKQSNAMFFLVSFSFYCGEVMLTCFTSSNCLVLTATPTHP